MTHSEIKLRVLDWLDDPEADQFDDDARLDRIMFDAYADVVHVVDESPVPYNIRFGTGDSTIPNKITWAVGVREVNFSSTIASKILQVVPLDGADREGKPYTIVPFKERNNREHKTGIYINPGFTVGAGVQPNGQVWVIGQCDQLRGKSIDARVYWRPPVGSSGFGFKSDAEVPILVPFEYHYLIAIRAALLAKIQAKREFTDLAALWREGAQSLGSFTSSVGQGGKRL